MSIFEVRELIIEEYGKYIQSFLHISDDRVREFVESEILAQGALWPEALLQLNPAYETEPVNNFWTLAIQNYCCFLLLEDSVTGGFIHTASGKGGGVGTPLTNLSGCAL